MSAAVSSVVVLLAVGLAVFVLHRQDRAQRSQFGPAGVSEFRTALPIDECLDRLDAPGESDVFAYSCQRDRDGTFTLHLTMHRPTGQPVDTLYTLRLDPGRETVVTLIFVREAFGYKEPVFLPGVLDEFMAQKLDAHRTR